MKPDPIKNDVSKKNRKKNKTKAKQTDKACIFCGSKTNLDAHHICGKDNDKDLTASICRLSHPAETALQVAAGIDLDHTDRSFLERLVSILRSLALLFSQLGDKLREWADKIAAHIQFLDTQFPGWDEFSTEG